MMRIKVCGMCNSLNVKEIAGMNPDFMGFIFYPGSPRYVGEEPGMALFSNVSHFTQKAGVFVNESHDRIINLIIKYGLDLVQLHGNESPDYCLKLKSLGVKIIKAFMVKEDFDFNLIKPFIFGCDFFLFDTKTDKPGGSGTKFNWNKLIEYNLDKFFFLSGGVGPDDVELLKKFENKGFLAVDINSRFEISPGLKNVSLVRTFIDKIKSYQI